MNGRFSSAEQAEAAFYAAFEAADLEAMMRVWACDPDVVCIHPRGPRLAGRDDIRASWRLIFGNPSGMRLRPNVEHSWRSAYLATHLVTENIFVAADDLHASVLATNIYRLGEDGWRMVLHHASAGAAPAPAPSPHAGVVH